jgi:hypothetical protein
MVNTTATLTGNWLSRCSPAFRLLMATSWLAPETWRPRQGEAIREACVAGVDWDEYVRLVERHRIPALSWTALKRVTGITIPDEIAKNLKQRSDACRMKALVHLQLLAGILKAFNSANIPAMPLKGPLASLELYGDAGLRESKDLDVLVSPAKLAEAQQCLCQNGWRLRNDESHLTPRQSEFRSKYEQHLTFVHASHKSELELHWRTLWGSDDTFERRWQASIAAQWQGCSYRAMNAIDLAVQLCEHGSGHAWFRAKWLGDMARMYSDRRIEPEAVLARARTLGQERPVLQCFRLLRDGYALPMPAAVDRELSSLEPLVIRRAVQKLIDPAEPRLTVSLRGIRQLLLNSVYVRMLWPCISIRDTFTFTGMAICSADFGLIRLSDRLFWLYVPLRPFLWAWRRKKSMAL